VCLAELWDHKLNNFILGVQNDVTELAKVLNDILGLKVAINQNHFVSVWAFAKLKVRVLNKFFDNGVQNSVVLLHLRQPRSTGQTQSRIGVLQKVDHVVQSEILLT